MTFGNPWLLFALFVVPAVIAVALFVERRQARYPIAFTNLELLAGIVEEHRSLRRYVPLAALVIALAFAAGALARPNIKFSAPDQHATVVLLVDVSGSMRATDVRPTRLRAAVAAMQTFLDRLPPQFQVGLVEFSSDVEILSDPTTDRDSLKQALSYLSPQAATSIGDGINTAVQMAKRALTQGGYVRPVGTKNVPAAIILLSDGTQNHGALSPIQGADLAKAAGIRIYPVSLGTPKGKVVFGFGEMTTAIPVPPDPVTMDAIARTTGGRSYTAQTADQAVNIYQELGSSLGRQPKLREVSSWFAATSALFLIAAVGFGRLGDARLP